MGKKERVSAFKEDKCDLCGQCFHQCPVLALPLEEAINEINNLIQGKESKYVLSGCNTCLSCNHYCPRDANPYGLILERWNEMYKERGAPPLYRFVCPTEEPNIWQLMNLFLTDKEKSWIDEWMNYKPGPDDRLLLIGSYTHLFPFIIGESRILTYFKPVDRIDQWEAGAYLYQGGYLDIVRKIAERTKSDFDEWGVKTVVPMLDAVHYLFTEVHPLQMGVRHEQEFINFDEWLLGMINSNEIKLTKRLGMKVTVHDNCYSKALGDACWNTHREILKRCGCEIVEMKHIREDALCCGFGAGASWVRNASIPFDIISEGKKRIDEAEETGGALVSYCSGCIYLLWAARELSGSKIDIYHHVEIVRMAMGEKLNYPDDHVNRTWDVISIITYQLLISIFQKNFFIKSLTYDTDLSSFKQGKHRLLRIIRFVLKSSLVRRVYARVFRVLMSLIRTR